MEYTGVMLVTSMGLRLSHIHWLYMVSTTRNSTYCINNDSL